MSDPLRTTVHAKALTLEDVFEAVKRQGEGSVERHAETMRVVGKLGDHYTTLVGEVADLRSELRRRLDALEETAREHGRLLDAAQALSDATVRRVAELLAGKQLELEAHARGVAAGRVDITDAVRLALADIAPPPRAPSTAPVAIHVTHQTKETKSMVYLRNPGPWTFAIIAVAAALMGFLFYVGSPDAVKLAVSISTVVFSALTAKSAIAQAPKVTMRPDGSIAPAPRPPSDTWPRSADEWTAQEVDVKELGK